MLSERILPYLHNKLPRLQEGGVFLPRFRSLFTWTNWLGWKQWLVLFGFGIVVIAVEIRNHQKMWLEHNSGQTILTDHMLVGEMFIFGLILPLAFGLFLAYAGRTAIERDKMARSLELRQALIAQIHASQSWEDLADLIVTTPGNLVAADRAWLLSQRPGEETFDQAAQWVRPGGVQPIHHLQVTPSVCATCTAVASATETTFIGCSHLDTENNPPSFTRYCRWLTSEDTGKTALLIDVPHDRPLSAGQLKVLEDLSNEMSLAIVNANLHYEKQKQVDDVINERQRIARNLHDTLGQNISYLRLKLEQLSSDRINPSGADLQADLSNMLKAADEAYGQVRDTLEELRTAEHKDLGQSIRLYAAQAGQRAAFKVQTTISGKPRPLTARRNRQIMYILREALNNVEKHAQASNVTIHLQWLDDTYTMTIEDNGVGFDPAMINTEERYGVTIMSERSRSINAELLVESAPAAGTKLSLTLPLSSGAPSQTGDT